MESRNSFSIKQQHKLAKAVEKIILVVDENKNPDFMRKEFSRIISKEYTKTYILDNKYMRLCQEGDIYVHNLSYYSLGYLSYTNIDIENSLLKNNQSIYEVINQLVFAKNEVNSEIGVSNIDEVIGKYALNKFKEHLKENLNRYLNVYGYKELLNIKKINERIDKESSIEIDLYDYKDLLPNEILHRILTIAYDDSKKNIKVMLKNVINEIFKTLSVGEGEYSLTLGYYNAYEGTLVQNAIIQELSMNPRYPTISVIYKIDKETNEERIKELAMLISQGKNVLLNINEEADYFAKGIRIYENVYSDPISKGRMNVCNTSINIARLGLKHKALNQAFYEDLEELLKTTRNELITQFEYMGDKSKDIYKFIFNGNIYDDEKLDFGQKIRKVIKNGTLNINLVGLTEFAKLINEENCQKIIIDLVEYISNKVKGFILENKMNFTLSSVTKLEPNRTFIEIDKTAYGLIDQITNKQAYDNVLMIDKIDNLDYFEQLVNLLNGGSKIELLKNKIKNEDEIVNLINKLKNKKIGLLEIIIGEKK